MSGETVADRMRAMRKRRPAAVDVIEQPFEDPRLKNRRGTRGASVGDINETNARRVQNQLFGLIPGLREELDNQDRE